MNGNCKICIEYKLDNLECKLDKNSEDIGEMKDKMRIDYDYTLEQIDSLRVDLGKLTERLDSNGRRDDVNINDTTVRNNPHMRRPVPSFEESFRCPPSELNVSRRCTGINQSRRNRISNAGKVLKGLLHENLRTVVVSGYSDTVYNSHGIEIVPHGKVIHTDSSYTNGNVIKYGINYTVLMHDGVVCVSDDRMNEKYALRFIDPTSKIAIVEQASGSKPLIAEVTENEIKIYDVNGAGHVDTLAKLNYNDVDFSVINDVSICSDERGKFVITIITNGGEIYISKLMVIGFNRMIKFINITDTIDTVKGSDLADNLFVKAFTVLENGYAGCKVKLTTVLTNVDGALNTLDVEIMLDRKSKVNPYSLGEVYSKTHLGNIDKKVKGSI